ncbi:MAG: hypothetical protein A2026_01305 [Deltaproteobacteria bacterium RBG_19FT_COMBO_46_12]|nr:MAG: hypothetical protein A2026_01305 [Deltaproteobacteria bacterium RBG_19FT_COMBO_46_12]
MHKSQENRLNGGWVRVKRVAKYKACHDPKQLKLGLEVLQRDYPNSEWTKKAQVYSLIPG